MYCSGSGPHWVAPRGTRGAPARPYSYDLGARGPRRTVRGFVIHDESCTRSFHPLLPHLKSSYYMEHARLFIGVVATTLRGFRRRLACSAPASGRVGPAPPAPQAQRQPTRRHTKMALGPLVATGTRTNCRHQNLELRDLLRLATRASESVAAPRESRLIIAT